MELLLWSLATIRYVSVKSISLSTAESGMATGKVNGSDLKFKVISVQNDKTTQVLTAAHGVAGGVRNIMFCPTLPASIHGLSYDQLSVNFNDTNVVITKPNTSWGGADLVFYVLIAYI